MNIITHVIPNDNRTETSIHAETQDKWKYLVYKFSHAYDLLHDSRKPGNWVPGITDINAAIIYVMNVDY